MKKLFISCPMKGRTETDIRQSMEKMHKIAEAVFGEELEVIPSYIEDNPPETANVAVWYLGESIKMMAAADYFVGIYDSADEFSGCAIEREVSKRYGIPRYIISLNIIAPDVIAARRIERERESYNSYNKLL